MKLLEGLQRSAATIRVAVITQACEMAAQFATAGLGNNTIDYAGHRFVPSALKLRTVRGKRCIYYCKCGRVAVRDNTETTFLGLGNGAAEVTLDACRLDNR
jgi:hypothetical protein